MKEFVKFLIDTHLEEIVSKSLLNCHCEGLHSIMLLDQPEKRVRLFIAMPGNVLCKNGYPEESNFRGSVAFHSHHCDITLHVIKGFLMNLTIKPAAMGLHILKRWKFSSGITGDQIRFTPDRSMRVYLSPADRMHPGSVAVMRANEIHTVATNKNQLTAWFVYEGKEDPNYDSYCYTNTELDKEDFSHLYKKPNEQQVLDLLSAAGLLDSRS